MPPDRSANPCCPRCDYDQSGAIASWAEACPLRGTCPECGYEFAWREVYSVQERTNARFVEHARVWRVPGAAWRSLVWTAVPGIFWRQVQLRHEVRVQRWLVWFAWTIGLLYALGAAFVVAGRWVHETRTRMPGGFKGAAPFDPWWVADGLGWPLIDVEGGFFGMYGVRVVRLANDQWSAASVFMATMSTLMMVLVLALPQTRKRCKVRVRHVLRAAVYSWSWLAVPAALRLAVAGRWTLEQLVLGRDPDLYGMYLALHRFGVPLIVLGFGWHVAWWSYALRRGWRMPGAWHHAAMLAIGSGMVALLVAVVQDESLGMRLFNFTGSFAGGRGWRW